MPKLTIKVDPDLCIGAASCVTIAPETFQLNAKNKAEVLDHGNEANGPSYERVVEVTDEEKASIIEGAESCPTLAVFIYNEEGKQIFPEE